MNLNDAKILAELHIEAHLGGDWSFAWNSSKTSFGICKYREKQIVLSSHMTKFESEDHVEQTILHEIAHAKTPGSGHNKLWKMVARGLGVRNPSASSASSDPKREDPNWTWVMVYGDEIVHGYFRKPGKRTFECIEKGLTWIRGRKAETQGKLELVPNRAFQRKRGA